MDVRKIAAEKKVKALAELKEAEEMERAADQIAQLAAKHGWDIDIVAKTPDSTMVMRAKRVSRAATTRVSVPARKGGKRADPNSLTSRSKAESVNIVRRLQRPVPLSELVEKLAAAGIRLGGQDPNQTLSANLCRCPELVSTKRGWWLVGKSLPPETSASIGRPEGLPGLN